MNLSAPACQAFEHDISLFVDHALPAAELSRLTAHLAGCQACSHYLEDLRELADMHRDAAAMDPDAADAAFRGLIDRHKLFADITTRLLRDTAAELARLFYELGKAYVLAGNQAAQGRQVHKVDPVSRPVDIRVATDRARRVVREAEALTLAARTHGADTTRATSLFQKARRPFRATAAGGVGALATGQHFLLAALRLRPDYDEARLYLGFHHMLTGHFDRAAAEFRRVYRVGKELVHRLMALQYIGNVHSTCYDHRRAIECYEQVVAADRQSPEPRFYTALVNLGMDCAKLGLEERCAEHFAEVVERFPSHLTQSRQLLSQATDFTALLQRDPHLRESLRRRVPALFAA